MKKNYTITNKIIFLSTILLFTSVALSEPEWITFPGGSGTPGEQPMITILENNSEHTVYSVDIPGMWREQVVREGITFDNIHLPEYGYSYDIGWPQVPNIQELFATPEVANENVEVNILDYDNVILDDYYLYPVQHPIKLYDINVPQLFDYDEEFYQNDVWYPLAEQCAEGVAPGTFRDFDVITIALTPMKFNPYQRELEVRHHIIVEIRYIGTLGGDYWSKYNPSKDFQKMYPYLLANIKGPWIWEFDKEMKTSLNPDYLIIYDDMFENQLDDLKDYLEDRGYTPIDFKLSDIGNNELDIWNFIRQKWNDWHIEYVLLIGNDPNSGEVPLGHGIPMPYWTKDVYNTQPGPSDIGYARLTCINGPQDADIYPDIIVGRLPVSNVSEFDDIVFKTIYYHDNNTPEKENWEDRCLLVASRENIEFKNTKVYIADYRNYLDPPGGEPNAFEPCYGIDGKLNQDVVDYLNDGYSIVNYYGRGETEDWLHWDAEGKDWCFEYFDQLTNMDMLSCIFNCTDEVGVLDRFTGDVTECQCEDWLIYDTNDANKKGAVACCGATRKLSFEEYKLRHCDENWFKFIYGTHNTGGLNEHLPIKEFGAVVYGGITEYMFKYTSLKYDSQQSPLETIYYPDVICVYGDPSLSMRNGVGEGTLSKENTNVKTMSITPLSIYSIYPNPLYDDDLNIDILSISNQKDVNLKIYDISGRLVNNAIVNLTSGINKIKMNTSMLSSGVYIIEISSRENKVSSKFVRVR